MANEETLERLVMALIMHYGPMTVIKCVVRLVDKAIEQMALDGQIKTAKEYAELFGECTIDDIRGV